MAMIDARLTFFYCLASGLASASLLWMLSDDNEFLKQFIGVVVIISLASTANIHIALLRKEEKLGREDMYLGTRERVKSSAFSLIWAMFLSVILVVAKPLLPDGVHIEAFANSVGLGIILWGILIILDITKLSFKL